MVKEVKSMAELQETIAGAQGKLVVIDFFATWCGPCVAIAPYFQELGEKYKNVVYIKIDVDNSALEDASKTYKINCMPTFVFVKNNKEVDRLEGANKETLDAKIKQHSS